ncbi:MAG: leucine-rich repeat domain-containing protein, partial [Clostridia bacterium]|nr:leucine-rich repeat domain-containing protein [Clostridia bacterium]
VIIIKNSDLDIEVAEKTKIPANYLLISMGYETNNIEQNGKVYGTNVAINITRLMNQNQYTDLKKEQAPTVSDETKKQAFLEYCNEWYYPEEEFTSIDDVTLFAINYWGYGPFETLEEALLDETVQADIGTTKGEAYWFLLIYDFNIELEDTDIEENQAIDAWYQEKQHGDYVGEYYDYTNKINLYLAINGVEQETPINESIDMRSTETVTVNYVIGQNGTYEFILKTRNGEEIAREILRVSNIETDNPYYVTGEDAQNVWITNGKGTITEYKGTDTEVIVPLVIDGEIITTVGGFRDNTNITSVTIPEGITEIDDSAFSGCTNLTNVTIPEGVTYIDSFAFSDCTNLTNITIPETVTSISTKAFEYCENLKSVTMPSSLTSLGYATFYKCKNLTSIKVPEGITSIGSALFCYCEKLTDITIPYGVTKIYENAFYGCKSLTSITIPESVTEIGAYTFSNCTSLEDITIPETVTSIGSNTFAYCENLTSIAMPNHLDSLGTSTFYKCTNLTNITIPEGITSIGSALFCYCEKLTDITIPYGVTKIHDNAFYGCKSLTNLTIPETVTSIEYYAFCGCESLISIKIPNSVTSMASDVFHYCTKLTNIYFAPGDNPIPEGQYWGAPNENVQVIKLEQEQTQDPNEEIGN